MLAAFLFVRSGLRGGGWQAAYQACRSNLGRGILLRLELLVGADIISTITAPLTFQSVPLLGGIVMIRTFLSFSLEMEIEGCWPWQGAGGTVATGGGVLEQGEATPRPAGASGLSISASLRPKPWFSWAAVKHDVTIRTFGGPCRRLV